MRSVRRWAVFAVVAGLVSTSACSAWQSPSAGFKNTGTPDWKCVEVHERYGNAVPVGPVEEIPPVWDHLDDFGEGVAPRQVVLQTGHACRAWQALGRSWDAGSPTWVRSRETDDGRGYDVEVAGTLTYEMHPEPEQLTRLRADVVATAEGWRVESFTGPVRFESAPLLGASYRSTAPVGHGWREAKNPSPR